MVVFWLFLGFLIVVAVIVGIILRRCHHEVQRGEAIGVSAAKLELEYTLNGTPVLIGHLLDLYRAKASLPKFLAGLEEFEFFNYPIPFSLQGCHRAVRNIVHGESDGNQIAIFDFHYQKKHSRRLADAGSYTITHVVTDGLSLPTCKLRPRQLLDPLRSLLGAKDIRLEGNIEFNKQFCLRGDDEDMVTAWLQGALADFFLNQDDICFESSGDRFVIYHPERRCRADELRLVMERGLGVLAQLRDAQPSLQTAAMT